jgi:hypothetical protein
MAYSLRCISKHTVAAGNASALYQIEKIRRDVTFTMRERRGLSSGAFSLEAHVEKPAG